MRKMRETEASHWENDIRGRHKRKEEGGEGYGERKTHDKREEEKGRRWEECGDGGEGACSLDNSFGCFDIS